MRLCRGQREGFKHQIRALLSLHGLPIIGDLRYGGPRCEALALHAAAVQLPHPILAHPKLRLRAAVPPEWGRLLPPSTRSLVALASRRLARDVEDWTTDTG